MADIDTGGGGGRKKGGKRSKKLSTRVDMTPMVDLGFLLITFFVFTTTMSKPKTMQINMPYKDENKPPETETKIKESCALTILLGADNVVYYYEGMGTDPANPPVVKATKFKDQDGIRDVIIKKKKAVEDLRRAGALLADDKLTVLIKPDATSTYDDLVNILDEMNINMVPSYAVVDITDVDKELAGIQ